MALYAQADDGHTILATKERRGQRAPCPGCEESLLCKAGDQVRPYWSHRAHGDCDPWYDPENKMSDWHLGWQELVTRGRREVRIVRGEDWHRADIQAADGQVVEVQHSAIPPSMIRNREDFYGDMVWIWDTRKAYGEGRLILSFLDPELPPEYRGFTWTRPWGAIGFSQKRGYFDLGDGRLLQVESGAISTESGFHGWGKLVSKAEVVEWINDGPPPEMDDPRIALEQRREVERIKRADAERRRVQAEVERQRIQAEQEAERAAAERAQRDAEWEEWAAADQERRAAITAEREAQAEQRRKLQVEQRARLKAEKAEADARWEAERLALLHRPCGHWSDGELCGDGKARPYACGWRCDLHCPSALAGRPHPDELVGVGPRA